MLCGYSWVHLFLVQLFSGYPSLVQLVGFYIVFFLVIFWIYVYGWMDTGLLMIGLMVYYLIQFHLFLVGLCLGVLFQAHGTRA